MSLSNDARKNEIIVESLAKNLVKIKKEFVRIYNGNSHIQEVIPISKSDDFPINEKHLRLLHLFVAKNPIYYNSYEQKISEVPCRVYEGDINQYWLNSIKNNSSQQPFYPTWICSAYIIALQARNFEYTEAIDIGSGDGRIAFCAKILDLESHGIEIDDDLVELQKLISNSTKINFDPNCGDAVKWEYSKLKLKKPIFFIGGLAQMGGDILATSIIEKIRSISNLREKIGMVFVGTYSKKYLSADASNGGWNSIISKNNMKVIKTISLPTVWTFDQPEDSPYIFTELD